MREKYNMDVFLAAGLETYEDFLAVYQEGDEKRKDGHQERDLILHALSNSRAAQKKSSWVKAEYKTNTLERVNEV